MRLPAILAAVGLSAVIAAPAVAADTGKRCTILLLQPKPDEGIDEYTHAYVTKGSQDRLFRVCHLKGGQDYVKVWYSQFWDRVGRIVRVELDLKADQCAFVSTDHLRIKPTKADGPPTSVEVCLMNL